MAPHLHAPRGQPAPDENARFAAVMLVNTAMVPVATITRAANVFLGLPELLPTPRPRAEWTRYVGTYLDRTGSLGALTVRLEGGALLVQFQGHEPTPGLPSGLTFFPQDGAEARFVVTNIGVAERVPGL